MFLLLRRFDTDNIHYVNLAQTSGAAMLQGFLQEGRNSGICQPRHIGFLCRSGSGELGIMGMSRSCQDGPEDRFRRLSLILQPHY